MRALVTLFVGIALTVPTSSLFAQSTQEIMERLEVLRGKLAELEAQLAALQQQKAQLENTCAYTWTRSLSMGDAGTDVLQLQRFLNAQPGILVAAAGPGSPGQETTYFGSRTATAVRAFQERHAQRVLAPVGLPRGTGVFGPRTREVVHQLCGKAPVASQPALREVRPSGEAGELTGFQLADSRATLSEGERRTAVRFRAGAEFAPVTLQSATVLFEAVGAVRSDEPWEYIDAIELRRGFRRVVHIDASAEERWANVGRNENRVYRLRLGSFSVPIEEDDTERFSLVITAREFIDSADVPQQFAVAIAGGIGNNNGIRGIDSAGATLHAGSWSDRALVTFVAE